MIILLLIITTVVLSAVIAITKVRIWQSKKRINKLRNAIKRAPLSYYIVFSFSILILYTIVEQVLTVFGFEPNDTLTTCFFSTFGGEVLCASLIKIFKLKGAEDE